VRFPALPQVSARSTARFHKTPLQVKLLASVLALVMGSLLLISVSSTFALRSFMLSRIDDELKTVNGALATTLEGELRADPGFQPDQRQPNIPSDYMFALASTSGVGTASYNNRSLHDTDMPPFLKDLEALGDQMASQPYTTQSINGRVHWRMRINRMDNGDVLYVGRNLGEIEYAVTRLIWIDLAVGIAVTLVLAAVGATIVRRSLVPLVQIERTAGAIAAGDLTQRVPDPEPGDQEPRTELGRLSRALNAMLTQIEAAFTARALSETAARSAESSARDAAEAAKVSEARAVRSEGKMRQFVADASHELRTPLTTIRGFAELYRQGAVKDPEDVSRLVRRIEDEAARMGLLVEDLLLLARLDRERPIVLEPVELPVIAIDAVQAAQATAPDRTITLDINDKPEQLLAYGDDARLRQVVGNLMTNALVHTPPDASVTLRLYAETGNRAVIEISDTGPGLSAEQRDHVFERFYRADQARTRHTDRVATGTGLGLAIVAAIVRAHHGSVELLSDPGEGATFRVTLPALEPESHPTE